MTDDLDFATLARAPRSHHVPRHNREGPTRMTLPTKRRVEDLQPGDRIMFCEAMWDVITAQTLRASALRPVLVEVSHHDAVPASGRVTVVVAARRGTVVDCIPGTES